MKVRKAKVKKLKEYFEKREDVVMAFLFGSQAKGATHAHSDWDIAVYFKTLGNHMEWQKQDREYPDEKEIRGDCMNILYTDDVDLIVLNRAPSTIADTALHGIPLVIKDKNIWLEFMFRVTNEAIDFRKFARGYSEVFWRSASLSSKDAVSLDRR